MGTNQEIARIFDSMADLLELRGVPWKPRAYRAGARSLEALRTDVRDLYRKGGLKALEGIPGIGEGLAAKIIQYLSMGRVKDHEGLKRSVPPGLRALLEVPGLGPYRARRLQQRLGLTSLAGLKAALRRHEVAGLPEFGLKGEQWLRAALGLARPPVRRYPRREALRQAVRLLASLGRLRAVERIEVGGSIRRGEPTVGDIDLLAVSRQGARVMKAFTGLPFVEKVLVSGPKKSMVLLSGGMQADLRVVGPESFGAAMIHFTGNKLHNILLRRLAVRHGWKLNEYGLFDGDGRPLAGGTEEGVYGKLGLKFIPPEERKGGDELVRYLAAPRRREEDHAVP